MIAIVFVIVILSLAYVGLQGNHNIDINAQIQDLVDEPKRYENKSTQIEVIDSDDEDYIVA